MHQVDNRTGIEVIDRAGCLRLLAETPVGRIGLVEGGAPLVLPVNYALAGESIVFRTAPGTKLDAAHRAPACFEIDHFEPEHRSGWSVLVRGHLVEVDEHDHERWAEVAALPDPWAEGPKEHVLCLEPHTITGRRVPPRTPSAPEG
jgi:nitroimidazol reductase NimA-like FMN-containing flavoprotein (pyridoxamine 5'-phosphate oxidase superfamily)